MAATKTQIVLDADVIIHFFKGGKLSLLPHILSEFQFIILDIVKRELPLIVLQEVSRLVERDKTIAEVVFGSSSGEKMEYARLTSSQFAFGRGESACMVYCLYHHDVLGSSNLKDIRDYCQTHGITYLTTVDFLFYAIRRNMMTSQEAHDFVRQIKMSGSRLPDVDFDTYVCDKL